MLVRSKKTKFTFFFYKSRNNETIFFFLRKTLFFKIILPRNAIAVITVAKIIRMINDT